MSSAVGAAIVASAVVGAGTTMYANQQQKDAAEKAARDKREAERRNKIEAERIAKETRPEGEQADSIEFGNGSTEDTGNVSDFVIKRKDTTTGLGSSTGGSGLSI